LTPMLCHLFKWTFGDLCEIPAKPSDIRPVPWKEVVLEPAECLIEFAGLKNAPVTGGRAQIGDVELLDPHLDVGFGPFILLAHL
jgi:hypothetical protein